MKKRRRLIIFILITVIFVLPEVRGALLTKDIVYKNEDIGMTMTFPKEWYGKYKIEERKDSVYVYFKPRLSISSGLLFAIVKLNDEGNPCDGEIYDIRGPGKIEFRGVKYTCGGTTGIGYPDNSIHFKKYMKMYSEASDVLKTLKELD